MKPEEAGRGRVFDYAPGIVEDLVDLDPGIGYAEVRVAVEQPFDVCGGPGFEDRVAADMQALSVAGA